jgi:hypothetical protein
MRGPAPQHPITLTMEERAQLQHLVRAHTTPHALRVRAQIVLIAHDHPDWNNQPLAATVACSDRTVRKWRARWVATQQLTDAPRSGAPRRFPPEVRAQAVAVACSLPAQQQTPLARWSYTALAQRLAELSPEAAPAPRTVGRWLRADKLKPWRYHSWQHIHDPVAFLARARPVLQLYAWAAQLWSLGTWVVCLDEKTSIQAREGETPPRPARPGQGMWVNPRYHRRGAVQLFASLSVCDGQVAGQCRARRKFTDLQAFVTEVLLPEARRRGVHTVALILDNGPTHAPQQLARWLSEQETVWGITVQVYWLPVRASWLDQMEIWFSVLQRKRLQPNHFASCADLTTAIEEFIQHYNTTAQPIQWTYTVDKLEQKLGTHL